VKKFSGVARSKLGNEINMNWFRPIKSRHEAVKFLAALFLSSAVVNSGVGQDSIALPESNPAKNLARMNCGAKIDWITPEGRVTAVPNASDRNSSATALLMDDDTLSCPLQQGETTFIISFPKTSLLDRFTFLNENAAAEGEMKIAVSNYRLAAESPKWTEVNGNIAFSHKRLFNLSMVGVEARYVKLSFRVQKDGRIAALGLYGTESLKDFSDRKHPSRLSSISNVTAVNRLEDVLNFNFANLYARAHIVFVSSGVAPSARRMIDDDPVTAFQFASSDPQPTVIIELADHERLHRVSTIYKMQAGKVDVYLLKKLGSNPGDLGDAKPIASVTDVKAGGKAAVDFDLQGARYVALRWTPGAQDLGRPFEVAEISAFGDMPLSMLNAYEAPQIYASNATALTLPGIPVNTPLVPLVSE
jgi:hypothetical protein